MDFEESTAGPEVENFELQSTPLTVLNRYEMSLQKAFYKALHELQRIQAPRLGIPTVIPTAIDIDVSRNE